MHTHTHCVYTHTYIYILYIFDLTTYIYIYVYKHSCTMLVLFHFKSICRHIGQLYLPFKASPSQGSQDHVSSLCRSSGRPVPARSVFAPSPTAQWPGHGRSTIGKKGEWDGMDDCQQFITVIVRDQWVDNGYS